jgi:N-acyl-L-homoserine lactone synthetase
MSAMTFQPPLVLDSNSGDAGKNYPIALRIYALTSDKTELYQLRYRAFLDAGWIAANTEGKFIDRYDGLASTFAVGAFHNGACIGSLRLAFGGAGYLAHTMPCEDQFTTEVRALNPARHYRTVEFSRMAVEPSLTNRSFRTTLYASLIRAGVILSNAADMDIALIAVHRRTSPFYQAMCGFKVAGKSDAYLGINEPTDFLTLQFSEIKERRMRSNTFFAFSEHELHSAREAMSDLQKQVA